MALATQVCGEFSILATITTMSITNMFLQNHSLHQIKMENTIFGLPNRWSGVMYIHLSKNFSLEKKN